MAKISNLRELYVDELKDLWSANDQMVRALKTIAPIATNAKLKTLLQQSPEGITRHTGVLNALIEIQDAEVSKDHCKGMEGLVKEAIKHTVVGADPNLSHRGCGRRQHSAQRRPSHPVHGVLR